MADPQKQMLDEMRNLTQEVSNLVSVLSQKWGLVATAVNNTAAGAKSLSVEVEKSAKHYADINELLKTRTSLDTRIHDITSKIRYDHDLIKQLGKEQIADIKKYYAVMVDVEMPNKQRSEAARKITNILQQQSELEKDILESKQRVNEQFSKYGVDLKRILGDAQGMNDLLQVGWKNGMVAVGLLAKQLLDKYKELVEYSKQMETSLDQSVGSWLKINVASLATAHSAKDMLDANKAMVDAQKGNLDVTTQTSKNIADMSAEFKISAQESGQIYQMFSTMPGMTKETAKNSVLMSKAIGEAINVKPSAMMKELASNSNDVARYTTQGGKNVQAMAAAAAKAGIEMAKMFQMADKLLDFEQSITAEMEASVMLGKDINLEKARALAFEGKNAAALAEVVNQIGDLSKMNKFQRDAAAAAAGVDVATLEKAFKAKGDLAKMDELVNGKNVDANGQILDGYDKMNAWITKITGSWLQIGLAVFAVAASLKAIGALFPGLAAGSKAVFAGIKGAIGGEGFGSAFKDSLAKSKTPQESLSKPTGAGIKSNLKGLSSGLSSMGSGKVALGILNLGLFAVAGTLALATIPFLAFMAIPGVGVLWETNFSLLSIGLQTFGAAAMMPQVWAGVGLLAALGGVMAIFGAAVLMAGNGVKAFSEAKPDIMFQAASALMPLATAGSLMIPSSIRFIMGGMGLQVLAAGLAAVAPYLYVAEALSISKPGYSGKGGATGGKGEKSENQQIIGKLDTLIAVVKTGGNVYLDKDKVGKALTIWGHKNDSPKSTGTSVPGSKTS